VGIWYSRSYSTLGFSGGNSFCDLAASQQRSGYATATINVISTRPTEYSQ